MQENSHMQPEIDIKKSKRNTEWMEVALTQR